MILPSSPIHIIISTIKTGVWIVSCVVSWSCSSAAGTDCKRKALKIHREKCLDCTAGRFLKVCDWVKWWKNRMGRCVFVKVRRSKVERTPSHQILRTAPPVILIKIWQIIRLNFFGVIYYKWRASSCLASWRWWQTTFVQAAA